MLDQLLAALDVQVNAFAICDVSTGWRLNFEADGKPSVHYVMSGSGAIRLPALAPIPLFQDSLVILPKGVAHAFEGPTDSAHEIRHDYFGSAPAGRTKVPRIRAGNGEDSLVVACGTIHAAFGGSLGLFDHLTHPLVESFAAEPLKGRFQALIEELETPSFGTRALTEAFLKQAVVLVLRRQMRQQAGSLPWLQVFQDVRLSRAVSAMLERPGQPFTLDELAATVGMSRSTFAEHFAAAFGQSPMDFLKHVRLNRAARLLEVTDLPIKAVAKSVGYESRSYFSRAFRAAYGMDPTEYRADRSGQAAVEPQSH